jgi:hypothetical protein
MHQLRDFLSFIQVLVFNYCFDRSSNFYHLVMTLKYFIVALVKCPSLFVCVVLEETEKPGMILERN